MLLSVKETIGARVKAVDGAMGHLKDIYFDDRTWEVRWLVAGLGGARTSPQVLIDPRTHGVTAGSLALNLSLRLSEAARLPLSSTALPVCRQYDGPTSGSSVRNPRDPHLRSCLTLLNGFSLTEASETVGALLDFCLDARHWTLPFLAARPESAVAQGRILYSTAIVRQISVAGARLLVHRPLGELLPADSVAAA